MRRRMQQVERPLLCPSRAPSSASPGAPASVCPQTPTTPATLTRPHPHLTPTRPHTQVPTDYYGLWSRAPLHTYQYSVTEYYHPLADAEQQQPAVYFLYDVSPIRVVLRDTRPGLLRLGVRVCAVVGGAFAVTGLLDKVVHRLVGAVSKAL